MRFFFLFFPFFFRNILIIFVPVLRLMLTIICNFIPVVERLLLVKEFSMNDVMEKSEMRIMTLHKRNTKGGPEALIYVQRCLVPKRFRIRARP